MNVERHAPVHAAPTVSRDQREPCAYERIATRVSGLQAIEVLAVVELERGEVSDRVWSNLWYFVGQVADDIRQDAEILWRDGRTSA